MPVYSGYHASISNVELLLITIIISPIVAYNIIGEVSINITILLISCDDIEWHNEKVVSALPPNMLPTASPVLWRVCVCLTESSSFCSEQVGCGNSRTCSEFQLIKEESGDVPTVDDTP